MDLKCPECGCEFLLQKIDNTDYQEVIDLYNATCKDLPKVEKLTDSRKRHIKARSKDLMKSKEDWVNLFERVNASDFLSGRSANWRANFDWFVDSPTNMAKVLEGNYDNRREVERKTVFTPPSNRPPLPSVSEWYKEAKETQAKINTESRRSATEIQLLTSKIGKIVS